MKYFCLCVLMMTLMFIMIQGKENVRTTFTKKIASIRAKRIDGIYGITKKRLCSRRFPRRRFCKQ